MPSPTSTWRDWSEKLSYTTRVKAWQENLMEKWVISRVESVLDSWMSFRQVFTLNRQTWESLERSLGSRSPYGAPECRGFVSRSRRGFAEIRRQNTLNILYFLMQVRDERDWMILENYVWIRLEVEQQQNRSGIEIKKCILENLYY